MAGDKPIITLNALVALGIDPDSAARVVREVNKEAGAIQRRLDQLNATKAQKSMDLWAASVKEAGGVSKLSEEQTKRLADQLERLAKAGAKVPLELKPATDAVNKLREAEEKAAKASADAAELKSGLLDKAGLGVLSGLGPAVGALAAVGAMAGASKATYDLINATAEHADQIADLATKYQVSTDAIQKFQFMAARTDTPLESIGNAIVTLTKNLDQAPEKFERWGLSVEHLRSLKPEELLGAMSEKLLTLNESDRLAFAKELMKGVDILPILVGGFDELSKKADEFAVNLSSADIESLNGLRDALDDIGSAWSGMWEQIGAAIGQDEDVRQFFETFKDGIVQLTQIIKENKSEVINFAKVLLGLATMQPDLVVKGAMGAAGLGGNAELKTYEWGQEPTKPPPGAHGPRPESAAERTARLQAEAQAAARRQKDDQIELDLIKQRDEATRSLLEAKLAVFDAEDKHALDLEARLAQDSRGSVTSDISNIFPSRGPAITDGAGPSIPASVMANAAAQAQASVIDKKDEQLKTDEAIAAVLAKQGYSQEKINAALGRTVSGTMSWSGFLQNTANQLSSMGQTGSAIGKIVGGVGGIGSLFEKGGSLNGVKGLGSLFSGGTGQVLGKLAGGATAAFAAFDIGKTLYTMFHKTEAQKVAFDVGRDYGVQISEGLSKEIASKSKTMGREAASLLSLDKIIGEAGGVQAFGVDKTIGKLHDLFSMVQTGKMTLDQAKAPFDKLFGEVAQASISKTTGLISLQVKELMALDASSGMGSEAVSKFRNEQRDIAATLIERLAGNKAFTVGNEQAASALGGALAAQYRRLVEQGLSGVDIAEKLGPQIDALQKKLDESGFGGGEAFDQMMGRVDLFRSEITGPTAQALQDLTSLTAALYNSGDLTRNQFTGLANQVGAEFIALQDKMVESGRDPQEAYQAMAGDLQKLWEMQRRYGVTLDETTQGILDQAEANGTVGEAQMSAQDRMAEGIDRLNLVMERIGETLGASFDDLPDRAKRAADGVNAALGDITPPDLGGTLNLPRDMGPYTPNSGVAGGKLEEAIADLAKGAEGLDADSIGKAISPGLSAVGDGLGSLADSKQTVTSVVKLADGAIIGSVTNDVNRNSPEAAALITAIAAQLKNRSGG